MSGGLRESAEHRSRSGAPARTPAAHQADGAAARRSPDDAAHSLAGSPRMVAQRQRIGEAFGAPLQGKWKEILGLGGLVLGGVGAVVLAPAAVAGVVATGVTAAVLGTTGYLVGRGLDASPAPRDSAGEDSGALLSDTATRSTDTTGGTSDKASTSKPASKEPSRESGPTPLPKDTSSRQPVKFDGGQVARFVGFVDPRRYGSLGKFMIAAKVEFLSESEVSETDWNLNRAAIQERAARYFSKEEEGERERDRTGEKAPSVSVPRPYDFRDSSTWTIQAVHSPNGTGWHAVNVGPHDQLYLDALRRGELTNNSTAASPVVGVRYHAHMVNNGGGGIAFYYEHTGGSSVRPVIYDWATTRTANNYHWVQARTTSNTAP